MNCHNNHLHLEERNCKIEEIVDKNQEALIERSSGTKQIKVVVEYMIRDVIVVRVIARRSIVIVSMQEWHVVKCVNVMIVRTVILRN